MTQNEETPNRGQEEKTTENRRTRLFGDRFLQNIRDTVVLPIRRFSLMKRFPRPGTRYGKASTTPPMSPPNKPPGLSKGFSVPAMS